MDGQTIEQDPRTAEYMRQREIFERSMAELKLAQRKKEAMGYAVMAAAYSFEGASKNKGMAGKAVTVSKLLLIAAVGIIPNVAMIMLLSA